MEEEGLKQTNCLLMDGMLYPTGRQQVDSPRDLKRRVSEKDFKSFNGQQSLELGAVGGRA